MIATQDIKILENGSGKMGLIRTIMRSGIQRTHFTYYAESKYLLRSSSFNFRIE